MLVGWGLALAAEPAPAPAPIIEIVGQIVEGRVRMVLAGREGDKVFVDDWEAGVVPVEDVFAEGEHVIRVEGPKGPPLKVTLYVKPVKDMLVQIDLAGGPNPAPTPVSATPAPVVPPPPPAPTISKN